VGEALKRLIKFTSYKLYYFVFLFFAFKALTYTAMSFLKKLFGEKTEPIKSHVDFWSWFRKEERAFYDVLKQQGDVEKNIFDKISPRLEQLGEGFFLLAGMLDENTAELVITPDGVIKNIVFVEDIISAAPKIEGWKFTALKPALDIKDVKIEMAGYTFDDKTLSFYANENAEYPDEIDITVVHTDYDEKNKSTITNGVYILLDNYLGELNFVTTVDNTKVSAVRDAEKELVPIEKLKDYLIWRQKEFIEKYEGVRINTEGDRYSLLEGELKNGKPMIASINTDLLKWDSKASHPWMLNVEIKYNGNDKGMPDKETFELLNEIEDNVTGELKDFDGFLYLGRQTLNNSRDFFIACKDFRKPSKVLRQIQQKFAARITIDYDIFKDKYWSSLNRFSVALNS
jgi:hypothetical protein